MQTNDKKEFHNIMTRVSDIYGKVISGETQRMWFEMLSCYELVDVQKAFYRHIANTDAGRFIPKPADIIGLIEGSANDGAAIAWTKAERAIGSPGIYCDVCFDDAIINRVLSDIGGWIKFCNSTTEEFPFIENDFKARYKAYRTRGNLEHYPKALTGITNLTNANKGFELEPVRLFGDQAKAQQVHIGGSFDPVYPVLPLSNSIPAGLVKRIEK